MAASELRRFDLRPLRDSLSTEIGQSLDHVRFSFFGQGATVSKTVTIPTGSSSLDVHDAGAFVGGGTAQVGLGGKLLTVSSVDSRTRLTVNNGTGASISAPVGTRLIAVSDPVTIYGDADGASPVTDVNSVDTTSGGGAVWIPRPIFDSIRAVGEVGYDNVTHQTKTGTGATLSWNHTASGSDRLVLVGVSWQETLGEETLDSITYDGTAMTLLASTSFTALYYLINPPTGSKQVVVTWSGTNTKGASGGAVSFTNVDQTHPLESAAITSGSSTTPTATLLRQPGMIFSTIGLNASGSTVTLAGPGADERWNESAGSSGNFTLTQGAGATLPSGGANGTVGWTLSASRSWGVISVVVRPKSTSLLIDVAGANVPNTTWVDARNFPDLQAAADAVAEGGTLMIPNGDYVVPDGGLVISKSMCVQGEPGTRLFAHPDAEIPADPAANQPVIRIAPGGRHVQGIVIRDLTLTSVARSDGPLEGSCGITCELPLDGSKVSRLTIERVVVYQMPDDGIYLKAYGAPEPEDDSFFVFVTLREVQSVGCRGRGLFASFANLLHCSGCYFADNDLEGFRAENSEPILIASSVENNCHSAVSREEEGHEEDRFALDPELGGQLLFLNCPIGRVDGCHVENFTDPTAQPFVRRGIVVANSTAVTIGSTLFFNAIEADPNLNQSDCGILCTAYDGTNSSPAPLACAIQPNWFWNVLNAVIIGVGGNLAKDCVVHPQHIASGSGYMSLPTGGSDSGLVALGNRTPASASGQAQGIFVPPHANNEEEELPTLTANDVGYMLFDTDNKTLVIWNGFTWATVQTG